MPQETPYNGTEVARLFAVDVSTVVRWADTGKLPSFRTPGGHRRYPRAAVDALLAGSERPDGRPAGAA